MTVKLFSTCPVPTNRERIWALIRELKIFSRMDLFLKTNISCSCSAIKDFVSGLEKAGFIKVIVKKNRAHNVYELVQDVGVDAPRVNKKGELLPHSGRSRMWKAMRILGTFTARDLAMSASLEQASVAVNTAEYYCKWLCHGGYLRNNGKSWTFLPAMNTGPKAPQILQIRRLYDPNRDAIAYECVTGGEL